MSAKKIITHRTPADGNIFADLGFAPDEAARLLADADQAIDEKGHSSKCSCPRLWAGLMRRI